MKTQNKQTRPGSRISLDDLLTFVNQSKSTSELRAIQIALTNQALRPTFKTWDPLKELGVTFKTRAAL